MESRFLELMVEDLLIDIELGGDSFWTDGVMDLATTGAGALCGLRGKTGLALFAE
jgi:hypothetical protein